MKTSSILVTGASGFIGRALCSELAKRGYPVRGAIRASANTGLKGCESVRISNISSGTDWTEALRGVSTVIHLAARVHIMRDQSEAPLDEFRRVNVAGTDHLARSAVANGVKRLVYVSSIGVNGLLTANDQEFRESDAPCPHNAYAISKWEAEQSLMHISAETGLEVVIVRPPLVYGIDAPGNFEQILKALAKGIPLPLGNVHNLRSLIYVGNLVDALIVCASHSAAAGNTYLVCDGEDVSTTDLLRQLGAAMKCPMRLFSCPPGLLRMAGYMVGKTDQVERLLGSLRLNSDKIRRELDWTPPFTLQQGLQTTAEWYRNAHL